jgi:5-methylcytosine-specific restriction endonuclease McrA
VIAMGKAITCGHGVTPKNSCVDCHREWSRNWTAKNLTPEIKHEKYLATRARSIVQVHNAKAKRLGVPGEITAEDYERVVSQPCVYCGYDKFTELDHIIPMKQGGTNELHNMQPTCRYCNNAKGSFGEGEFIDWLNRLKQSLVKV